MDAVPGEPLQFGSVLGGERPEEQTRRPRGESSLEAHHLAETLSIAWEDIEGLERWALEIAEKSPTAIRFIKAAFNAATASAVNGLQ